MIKKLKLLLASAAAALTLAIPLVLVPATANAADIGKNLCSGANLQVSGGPPCKDATGSFQTVLTSIVNLFSLVVGIVAVIMIIIGGFNYITSGGTEAKVSGAKNTILYAIIGLVIVLFAQVLVRFVIKRASPS